MLSVLTFPLLKTATERCCRIGGRAYGDSISGGKHIELVQRECRRLSHMRHSKVLQSLKTYVGHVRRF